MKMFTTRQRYCPLILQYYYTGGWIAYSLVAGLVSLTHFISRTLHVLLLMMGFYIHQLDTR